MKNKLIDPQVMRMNGKDRYPCDTRYLQGSAFVHGQYCPIAEATLPLYDAGFLHADAVYEKATVSNGRFFCLQEHLHRFEQSCQKFRLTNPYSPEETVAILSHLVSLTGLKNAGVFWCVTRGLMTDAKSRNNPAAFDNRFYAMVSEYQSIASDHERRNGLSIIVSQNYIRTPVNAVDPTAKNFHWADMKLSLFEATDKGKAWSVLLDAAKFLTEAPGANIVVVKEGQLYTPDSGCLDGITRQSVCELAETLDIATHIERVHVEQLFQADEAFLTTSAGGIVPISSVDDIRLGDGTPGKITVLLHNLYWQKMWQGWKGTAIDYEENSCGR